MRLLPNLPMNNKLFHVIFTDNRNNNTKLTVIQIYKCDAESG